MLHTNCLMSVIYGDCDIIPMRELWAGLISLSEDIADDPWCILVDFNVIWDTSEVRGRMADSTNAMAEFRDCITTMALVHLPFTGCLFSWHNCSQGSRSLWKCLDRVLVNEAWLDKWPRSQYISALPSTSDHSPLILSGYDRGREQGMFCFDNFLAKFPGFLDSVMQTWSHRIHGTRMYGMITKLKALKHTFRAQRKIRGDLSNNVHLAKGFLEKAQALFDTYKEATLLQLVEIGQGGNRTSRALDLSFLRPRLKHTITLEEANALISPITTQELKEAFFDISEDSAPGPDGYTSTFFKAAWPVIGGDVCAAVLEFFQSGRILKQINANLLALIPKVQLPMQVSDFSPIACCNVLYKALTKILVRRLQTVLHLLIDYSLNAFILGRSIADNVMLAQELLAGYNQNKLPPRCTIKIDIQKAYDSVNWDFILESLRIFNFPTRFIGWISSALQRLPFLCR
ncbi:UNVERIFIED_CONTAM: hypothetical protein Sradi_3617500 [Sesamum radiatum]|uniref:Reverse transcriptase domain-containing protein n=1 Tax=Sesamum radiatum TaxID=300843 RepID=A0AAW2QHC6_SESRA